MHIRPILLGLALLIAATLGARHLQQRQLAAQPLRWQPTKMDLPPSIRVFAAGGAPGAQPRAWYLDIDYTDRTLVAKPWLSQDPTGREPASAMAAKLGALVAINGGYFDMASNPAPTFSLVMQGGKIRVPNIPVVKRPAPTRAYPVTRSAFGIRPNRTFDVAWIARQGDELWAYPRPVPHTQTTVAPAPTRDAPPGGRAWEAVEAIGAGPTLISDGVIQDTYDNEVFFGAGFPNDEPYGRAAIGYTKAGHLILLATDSRQPALGLTLPQLAREMQRLGCLEAMNLDGGGSETLVVKGVALNQPVGQERPITSVLAFVPQTTGDPSSFKPDSER